MNFLLLHGSAPILTTFLQLFFQRPFGILLCMHQFLSNPPRNLNPTSFLLSLFSLPTYSLKPSHTIILSSLSDQRYALWLHLEDAL